MRVPRSPSSSPGRTQGLSCSQWELVLHQDSCTSPIERKAQLSGFRWENEDPEVEVCLQSLAVVRMYSV